MKQLTLIFFISLCLFFGIIIPVKYFLLDSAIDETIVLQDSFTYNFSFYVYYTFATISLLTAGIQFINYFIEKYIQLYKVLEYVYVASVFIATPFGIYISYYTNNDLLSITGFTFGSLMWFIATYLAFNAKKVNIEAHKKYMTYSYAGTFAAITLKFWLHIFVSFSRNIDVSNTVSIWLSWSINFFIAYLIVHQKDKLTNWYEKYNIEKALRGIVALSVLLFIVSFTSLHTWFYKKPSFNGTPLEKNTSLKNNYITSEKLNEIEDYLKKEAETTSMMVLENGKIIYEYGDVSEISNINAVGNSIVSLLYGKYVENDKIQLNETIGELGIDEDNKLLPIEKQATVNNVITSKSGVLYQLTPNIHTVSKTKKRGTVKPGSYFLYNDWDFNAASKILLKKSGKNVHKAFEEQLAIPLGFEDWNIANQTKKFEHLNSQLPSYKIHLSTRDMAKIGQLMLQNGAWNGKQIISEDWIKKITSKVTSKDTVLTRNLWDISSPATFSYGYLWWTFDRFYDNLDFEDAYTSWDESGQFITVIPKRNVVVVHKTKLDILTYHKLSDRSKMPSWRYWWILRKLMLNRKSIAELAKEKSVNEVIAFIKAEYDKESQYAISERLINEYGDALAKEGKHEDAIKFYELNLKLYPLRGYYTHRIYNYYGTSLYELGRLDDALKAFENSLALNKDNPLAINMISKLK
ncbi:DUF2306 domain-containing protein [Tenacibaculum sp. M341]|uniref:DUF2306 domain-containing protein n=1 Tax=Tenacibaculum sp. M341 TaxID=2530339 RepID=UPI00104D83EF|nr:DUF2306 domain-containing protein [Tenacibaculum sp. M341]TCI91785.1 DUF2306 domain-containing protein [Tenacibaculum sp. M341]